MTRRFAIAGLGACAAMSSARADAATDALEAVAALAGALSEGDLAGFEQRLRKGVPALDEIRENARSLIDACYITASIRPDANTGGEERRDLELDWYMELKSRIDGLKLERRQATVKCVVELVLDRRKKRWLVTDLQADGLFAPPRA